MNKGWMSAKEFAYMLKWNYYDRVETYPRVEGDKVHLYAPFSGIVDYDGKKRVCLLEFDLFNNVLSTGEGVRQAFEGDSSITKINESKALKLLKEYLGKPFCSYCKISKRKALNEIVRVDDWCPVCAPDYHFGPGSHNNGIGGDVIRWERRPVSKEIPMMRPNKKGIEVRVESLCGSLIFEWVDRFRRPFHELEVLLKVSRDPTCSDLIFY